LIRQTIHKVLSIGPISGEGTAERAGGAAELSRLRTVLHAA
jgi:hypothetical protein